MLNPDCRPRSNEAGFCSGVISLTAMYLTAGKLACCCCFAHGSASAECSSGNPGEQRLKLPQTLPTFLWALFTGSVTDKGRMRSSDHLELRFAWPSGSSRAVHTC